MAFERQSESAEFAEHARAPRIGRRHARTRIAMRVGDISDVFVVPAARLIDEPRRIAARERIDDTWRVVLAPPLVERHPHHDRRMILERADEMLELAPDLCFAG